MDDDWGGPLFQETSITGDKHGDVFWANQWMAGDLSNYPQIGTSAIFILRPGGHLLVAAQKLVAALQKNTDCFGRLIFIDHIF